MYGALLTQGRGPLLAFVPVFLAVIMLQAIRTNRWRLSLLMVVVACAGAVVATTTLRTKIIDRFTAIDQVLSDRSEEHTSELQSLMRISYAVFCLKTKKIPELTHDE